MVVAAVMGMAGCGQTPTTTAGAATMADVFASTVGAGSARVAYTLLDQGQTRTIWSVTTTGAFSWATSHGDLTTTSTLDDGNDSGAATWVQHEIDIGDVSYTEVSSRSSTAPVPLRSGWTEATWKGAPVRYLLSVLIPFPGASTLPSIDPSVLLGLLHTRSQRTETLGAEVIGGVGTRHHRSFVPYAAMGLPASVAAQAAKLTGTGGVTVDYWVDRAGLLRQLRLSVTLDSVPGAGSVAPGILPLTLTSTLDLSDYGVAVDGTAPPRSRIVSHQTCSVDRAGGFSCA